MDFSLGGVAFFAINTGIIIAGTTGLHNPGTEVVEALSRIILALVGIWKLQSDLRHLKLDIDTHGVERGRLKSLFYGLIYPKKEIFRFIKIIAYIVAMYYLITSALDLLHSTSVDINFLEDDTENDYCIEELVFYLK